MVGPGDFQAGLMPFWMVRHIAGAREAFEMLEVSRGVECATVFRRRMDAFFEAKNTFVKLATGFKESTESREFNDFWSDVDYRSKRLQELAGATADYVALFRAQITRGDEGSAKVRPGTGSGRETADTDNGPKPTAARKAKRQDATTGAVSKADAKEQHHRTQATQLPDATNTSRPMPLTEIANRVLKDPKKWRKLKNLYGDRLQQLGGKGSKSWTIRLDGLPPNIRKELERA
jgi:hypothetical protein